MKKKNVLPGFGLSMGYTIFYLSLVVLLPLSTLLFSPWEKGWDHFFASAFSPQVMAAYGLSFRTALFAALVNVVFGFLTAWALVRYRFWGRKIVDSLVDLPFALPTAVAGISLATLFSPAGWLGQYFHAWGIPVINTSTGIMIALVFIGFPFLVRTVQPVLEELEPEIEEAALSLGASRWQVFHKVILPNVAPALLTGFTLSFARALGEYGSVIFIAGNLPFKTEIAPLLIMAKLDQFDYSGASSIALTLLGLSFLSLVMLNFIQSRLTRRLGRG